MDRRFRPTHEARNRGLWVEPLESRWLFSGLPFLETIGEESAPSPDAPPIVEPQTDQQEIDLVVYDTMFELPSGNLDIHPPIDDGPSRQAAEIAPPPVEPSVAVEVVQLGVATSENVVPIAETDLPAVVVDAVDAHFPGAALVEAEVRDENGSVVYGVSTEFEGRPVDVTLTDDGNILDTAYELTLSELPQQVHDWVEQNFPGALIDGAELVTKADGVSYDLLIATDEGHYVAATLRLQTVKAPRSTLASIANPAGQSAASPNSEAVANESRAEDAVVNDEKANDPVQPQSPDSTDAEIVAHPSATEAEPREEVSDTEHAELVSEAMQADYAAGDKLPADDACLRAEEGPVDCLPERAGVIADLVPIDVASLERGLLELLDDVDSLVDAIASTNPRSVITHGAVVAGIVVGARIILAESKKRRFEPVLISDAATSPWSWMLGTTIKAK